MLVAGVRVAFLSASGADGNATPATVMQGTPIPPLLAPISIANAPQVVQVARWGNGIVSRVAWSPAGRQLAVASSLGFTFYQGEDLTETRYVETGVWITDVAFSPDGKMLATGADNGAVTLWNTSDGRAVRVLSGMSDWVRSIAFSPDGKTLAAGAIDTTIKLWEVASGREVRVLSGHSGPVLSIAFSPDGELLASGAGDNTVRLWDVANRYEVRTFSGRAG